MAGRLTKDRFDDEQSPSRRLLWRPGRMGGSRDLSAKEDRIVVAMVIASSATVLSVTASGVSAPAIARAFNTDVTGLLWVINSYALATTGLLLPGGSAADRFGHRRVLLVGLWAFVFASIWCALAGNLSELVGARIAQGAAAALVTPSVLATLDESFGTSKQAAAVGKWTAGAAIASIAGPAVGGLATDRAGWRWSFVVPIPFALLALGLAWRDSPRLSDGFQRERMDWSGGTLIAAFFSSAAVGILRAGGSGWSDRLALASLGVAVLTAAGVAAHQLTAERPVIPRHGLASRRFMLLNAYTFLAYFALAGGTLVTTLLLQIDLGWTATTAGAAVIPVNLLLVALSPAASRATRHFGTSRLLAAGAALLGIGLLALVRVRDGSSYVGTVLPAVVVWGAGLALIVAPLTAGVMGTVEDNDVGVATSLNAAAASFAALLATAGLPALASTTTDLSSLASDTGLHRAALISSSAAFVAALIIWPWRPTARGRLELMRRRAGREPRIHR